MTGEPVTPADIDQWTRHIWHVSQHNRMVIGLGARLQRIVHEVRAAAGLPEFGWNTAFPDAEFGECTVHVEGCRGQETHGKLREVIHLCPPGDSGRTPCCAKTPFELTGDRMTLDLSQGTCRG